MRQSLKSAVVAPVGAWRTRRVLAAWVVVVVLSALPALASSKIDAFVDGVVSKCGLAEISQWKTPSMPDGGQWSVVFVDDSTHEGYAKWHTSSGGAVAEELNVGTVKGTNVVGIDSQGAYRSVWSDASGCSVLSGQVEGSGTLVFRGDLTRNGQTTAVTIGYSKPQAGGGSKEDNPDCTLIATYNSGCKKNADCCSNNCEIPDDEDEGTCKP